MVGPTNLGLPDSLNDGRGDENEGFLKEARIERSELTDRGAVGWSGGRATLPFKVVRVHQNGTEDHFDSYPPSVRL